MLFLFRELSLRLVKIVIDELKDRELKGYIRTSIQEIKEKLILLIDR